MPQRGNDTTSDTDLTGLLRRPRRADARANFEGLLAAAAEVFTEHGTDATLDDIARRAGVGNATLYRHFPTRHALLVAVCVDEVESLCSLGARLQTSADADGALVQWLHAFVDHVVSKQGLAAALLAERSEGSAVVAACFTAIRATGASLLGRAQEAGAVRAGVEIDDLLTLVNVIAAATATDTADQADRLLALVLDGVRNAPA